MTLGRCSPGSGFASASRQQVGGLLGRSHSPHTGRYRRRSPKSELLLPEPHALEPGVPRRSGQPRSRWIKESRAPTARDSFGNAQPSSATTKPIPASANVRTQGGDGCLPFKVFPRWLAAAAGAVVETAPNPPSFSCLAAKAMRERTDCLCPDAVAIMRASTQGGATDG
jgi:hypothetical protein